MEREIRGLEFDRRDERNNVKETKVRLCWTTHFQTVYFVALQLSSRAWLAVAIHQFVANVVLLQQML